MLVYQRVSKRDPWFQGLIYRPLICCISTHAGHIQLEITSHAVSSKQKNQLTSTFSMHSKRNGTFNCICIWVNLLLAPCHVAKFHMDQQIRPNYSINLRPAGHEFHGITVAQRYKRNYIVILLYIHIYCNPM